jgi:alpha-beta hydrolase superfamily lysophospholipase
MPHHEDQFQTGDGLTLHENRWLPQGEAVAVVVVVHGIVEHGGRYAEMAAELNRHGIAVHAVDLRGHGRSQGTRIWVDRFEQYADDVAAYLRQVRQAQPDRPLFLFGHSMGGLIVAWLAAAGQADVRGLVLSAPAIELPDALFPLLRRLAALFSKLCPRLRLVKMTGRNMSRDPEVIAQFEADPLVFHGRLPARTGHEIIRAAGAVHGRLESITLPLLVLHGTGDVVTALEGSRQLHARAGSADKTLKLYDGLYHDLPREPEKGEIFGDVVGWLKQRM